METQLRDGALSLLRQEIADDLEGFLADADADMSGDVSWTEFEECCYRFLGEDRRTHVGPEALKALFDELATGHAPVGGGEGKEHVIVIDTFVEEMNAASLFVRDAGCATKIVFALLAKVRCLRAARSAMPPAEYCAAEQMRADLAGLSMQDIWDALQDLLPSALKQHCDQVKADSKDHWQASLATDSKFALLPTAAFGDEKDFDKGLGVLGAPHLDINDKMRSEMVDSDDSMIPYTSFNSGEIETCSMKEYYFVVDPFESKSKMIPPSQWRKRYDYPGNRTPIRLEVFLHALRAKQHKTALWFQDYKKAHMLREEDPQWLHEEEVSSLLLPPCAPPVPSSIPSVACVLSLPLSCTRPAADRGVRAWSGEHGEGDLVPLHQVASGHVLAHKCFQEQARICA